MSIYLQYYKDTFRRQFFIKEEDEKLLPELIQITYENILYLLWTYLSTNSAAYFVCKQSGHISKVCPNVNINTLNFTQLNSTPYLHPIPISIL